MGAAQNICASDYFSREILLNVLKHRVIEVAQRNVCVKDPETQKCITAALLPEESQRNLYELQRLTSAISLLFKRFTIITKTSICG